MMKKLCTVCLAALLCGTLLFSCADSASESYTQTSIPGAADSTVPAVSSTAPVSSTPGILSAASSQASTDGVNFSVYIDDGTGTFPRVTEFTGPWTQGKDIVVFAIMPSAQESFTGQSYSEIWQSCIDENAAVSNYRVGFMLTLTLADGTTLTKTVRSPEDITQDFTQYVELYLYDDIHQTPGAWYTHLSQSEITSETVITSIKLTAGTQISAVSGIAFSAFLYSGTDSFDAATGAYTGTLRQDLAVNKEG